MLEILFYGLVHLFETQSKHSHILNRNDPRLTVARLLHERLLSTRHPAHPILFVDSDDISCDRYLSPKIKGLGIKPIFYQAGAVLG